MQDVFPIEDHYDRPRPDSYRGRKTHLGDPVEKYLPQLSNRQVMSGDTVDDPKLVAASHPFTVRELITHTAGFTYEFLGKDAVHELWKRAQLFQAKSLGEFVDRLLPCLLSMIREQRSIQRFNRCAWRNSREG